jgi:hypothetical protein
MGTWKASWSSADAVAAALSMRQSSVSVLTRWVLRVPISWAVLCMDVSKGVD